MFNMTMEHVMEAHLFIPFGCSALDLASFFLGMHIGSGSGTWDTVRVLGLNQE